MASCATAFEGSAVLIYSVIDVLLHDATVGAVGGSGLGMMLPKN